MKWHAHTDPMEPPTDSHVHSQWSWDARLVGDMAATCARALARGLPAVAFTEHVDRTPFRAGFLTENYPEMREFVSEGVLNAPDLNLDGYLESIQHCRDAYPELTILTGLEVGQPHWNAEYLDSLLARGSFDRVLGSLHCLPDGDEYAEPWELFPHYPAADVFREYLAELSRLIADPAPFTALAHIDYPVRSWPSDEKPFNPNDFEDALRPVLASLADSGRALEINTRIPLDARIISWWVEEGGRSVTFGSDAHQPELVGHGLGEAGRLARSLGFAPGANPADAWSRTGRP